MPAPLLARAVLDAQAELLRAADHVPERFQDQGPEGMNSAAWILYHGASVHDSWVQRLIAGGERDATFEPFLAEQSGPPPFVDARAHADRAIQRATDVLSGLTEERLLDRAHTRPGSSYEGWTVGHMLVRCIAHLFVHAADLNVLATLGGKPDLDLPGDMPHTSSHP
jgi:uncharacterized damage-inducible protein DinB